jgi:hypothetical protein
MRKSPGILPRNNIEESVYLSLVKYYLLSRSFSRYKGGVVMFSYRY